MGIIVFKRSTDARNPPCLRANGGGPLMCCCFIATPTTCCHLFTSRRVPLLRSANVCDSFGIRFELSPSSLTLSRTNIQTTTKKRKPPHCLCIRVYVECTAMFRVTQTNHTLHRITVCACASHFDFYIFASELMLRCATP